MKTSCYVFPVFDHCFLILFHSSSCRLEKSWMTGGSASLLFLLEEEYRMARMPHAMEEEM